MRAAFATVGIPAGNVMTVSRSCLGDRAGKAGATSLGSAEVQVDGSAAPNVAFIGLKRDLAGLILSVDDGVEGILGWHPEQLVGRPSTEFIHPEDQPSGIEAWMDMTNAPGSTRG